MAGYIDGFLLPVPRKKIEAYRRISAKAGKVWREHGALEYRECVADDIAAHGGGFRRGAKVKAGETIVFSWIVYKSRAHRDKVNAKVMNDPRLAEMMNMKDHPFDVRRMAMGGFRILVDK